MYIPFNIIQVLVEIKTFYENSVKLSASYLDNNKSGLWSSEFDVYFER